MIKCSDYGWFSTIPVSDEKQALAIAKYYQFGWEEVVVIPKQDSSGIGQVWIINYRNPKNENREEIENENTTMHK